MMMMMMKVKPTLTEAQRMTRNTKLLASLKRWSHRWRHSCTFVKGISEQSCLIMTLNLPPKASLSAVFIITDEEGLRPS